MHDHDDDEHDLGFAHDRQFLIPRPELSRRSALGLIAAGTAGAGLVMFTGAGSAEAATATTPSETAGPYPADGSNGPNVLDDNGIVRHDIRPTYGSGTGGTAHGVPLRVYLRLVNASTGNPLTGAAVYLWHANRVGAYSLYSSGYTGSNYLRGIQVSDSRGRLSFQSIYPACYSGRWPHIHFEVYSSLAHAVKGTGRLLTSQIALPEAACKAVYADTTMYPGSASNLSRVSLSSDMVFGDGYSQELATMVGTRGRSSYTASLAVYA